MVDGVISFNGVRYKGLIVLFLQQLKINHYF